MDNIQPLPRLTDSELVDAWSEVQGFMSIYQQAVAEFPHAQRRMIEIATRLDERGIDPATWVNPDTPETDE